MDRHRLNISRISDALRDLPGGTSDFDFNPGARPDGEITLRPASVLVPLIEREPGLQVILTRRAARLRHHAGQISFPGGKQDETDASPRETALREAREEIGLMPHQVEILGRFDRHETVTRFVVTPFVGLVASDFTPRTDPLEVDEVFEVPLGFLLDPANRQIHQRRWANGWRNYVAIPYGPHYIWGATARMLTALADRIGVA